MTRIPNALRSLAFPLLAVAALWSATPVELHGSLSVKGNKIVDQAGRPATLRGASLFWSQTEAGEKYYNAKVVNWLADDWNATVVRAAMAVEGFDAQWGGRPDHAYLQDSADQMKLVKTVVDAAIARGIYVIVDWHDHNANLHLEKSKAFFKTMSETYGNTPNVIWEIWNEPSSSNTWSTVKSYADSVIPIIRKNSKNLVVVGTPQYSLKVAETVGNFLADPNTCYAIHFYTGDDNHNNPARADVRTVLKANRAVFASEWGASGSSGDGGPFLDNAKIWMDFLDSTGISSTNWAIDDKPETSAALNAGAPGLGSWTPQDLKSSGAWVRTRLRSYKDTVTPLSSVRSAPAPARWSLIGRVLRLKSSGWHIATIQDLSGRSQAAYELDNGATLLPASTSGVLLVQIVGPEGQKSTLTVAVPRL